MSKPGSIVAAPMRPPLTYVIDYGRHFLDDDSRISAYADAPPDLMHVGKTVPIVHNWGPVPVIIRENQTTSNKGHRGLDRDGIRLLSGAELEARIEMIKAYTRKWHEAGVGMLMCYSAIHTIGGDHQTREGFWNFYDHWDDYEKWLYPKPSQDPFDWLMVDKNGKFLPGACGGFSPPAYAPLHRYRVCPQHPDWQRFQRRLTQMIAEVGYDGVFPDNSAPFLQECFCRYCQEGFKAFVREMSARELGNLGVDDGNAVDLMDENLPSELLRRYRIEITARYQEMIGKAARTVNPEFKVFPNVCSLEDFMRIAEESDFVMFESTHAPGCAIDAVPPDEPDVAVEVVESAVSDEEVVECYLSVYQPAKSALVSAAVNFPRRATVGATVQIRLTVEKIGLWFEPAECARGFELILTNSSTGDEERVAMGPDVTIGYPSLDESFQPPPVELSASWVPKTAGRYRLSVSHLATNVENREVADDLPVRAELTWPSLYHTHIGQLLLTRNAGAAAIILDYESRKEGKEAVQELSMAQCAAFGNGAGFAAGEPVRRKYFRFFGRTRHLYEGFVPWADIGLLYSYWGHNPITFPLAGHFEPGITPSAELPREHRLITALCDRMITADSLAGLRSLILCGHLLEMSDEQIAAIRGFRDSGGEIYVYRADTTINAKPPGEMLGAVPVWTPEVEVAGFAPLLRATGPERGLRFSAYVHPSESRVVVHVLNFNVSYRQTPAIVRSVEDVTVTLPVPDSLNVTGVRVYDPDSDDVIELETRVQHGRVILTLPEVRIYKVVELTD